MSSNKPIDLPGEAWIVLRNPEDVTERQRRPVTRLMALLQGQGFTRAMQRSRAAAAVVEHMAETDGTDPDVAAAAKQVAAEADEAALSALSEEALQLLDDLNDASAVALIESWSFDAPVTLEELQNLKHGQYHAIRKAVAKPATHLLPGFEPSPAADSPTEPSQP